VNGLIEVNCPVPVPPHECKLKVTKPGTGEGWTLRVGDRLPTEHCGGLVVELHRPRVYDYLGLFKKRVRSTEPKKVCVMPVPEELQVPPDLSRAIARSWRPKYGGGYAENHEIRPYHPGDMMNLVHWKLSAKADTLMVREPMVPDGNKMIISLVLRGTLNQIDRKLGQLLWLGTWLLSQGASYEVLALTGNGTERWHVGSERELECCLEALLYAPYSLDGDLWGVDNTAAWHYRIGGEPDEE